MADVKPIVMSFVLLVFVLPVGQPAVASPAPVQPAAPLTVNLNFSPSSVQVNQQTTGSYAIGGGTPPYTIWENNTPPGCAPQSVPFSTPNPSGTFPCNPTATGNFNIHVDVQDNAGNRGSTTASLSVTSGGSGSGTNQTGGIDLSFLNNLLPVVMVTGILFLSSTVAIAVSAVALAILVPRRLKQIRKALEGQAPKPPEVPSPPTDQPKDTP